MASTRRASAAAPIVLVLVAWAAAPASAAPGDLDPAFGTGGVASVEMEATPTVAFDPAKDIALDGQQRIVVAGDVGSHIGLARLTQAGGQDPAFGGDGTVIGPSGGARAVAVDAADGVLVAGYASGLSGAGVLRFNPDGTLDDGGGLDGTPGDEFGTDGEAAAGMTIVAGLLVQPADGRIVLAGATGGSLVLRRFSAAGAVDASFGAGGTLTIPRPGATQVDVKRVALDAKGRILVAIQVYPGPSGGMVGEVLRVSAQGILDPGFGAGGIMAQPSLLTSDVIPQQERVIALGTMSGRSAGERFNADGAVDPGFGSDGLLDQLSFPSGNTSLRVDWSAGTLMPDGRLMTAGSATLGGGEVGLARFSADGQADTSFGTCGLAHAVAQAPGATGSGAIRVLAQGDGKALVLVREQSGIPTPARPITFIVARFLGGSGAPTPEVVPTTQPATAVTATRATLNGSIDPQGATYLNYGWDIGTDTTYGLPTGGDEDLAPGGVTAVSRTFTDLKPSTTYHYRLTAFSRCGRRIHGADAEFTTAAAAPTVSVVTAPEAPTVAPAAPASPVAFAVSVRLRAGQSLKTTRSAGLALKVTCSKACALDGRLLIDRATARRLGLPAGARQLTIGRGNAKLRPGVRATLTVRLTAQANARLARARSSVRLTLRLAATTQDGGSQTVERRLTLSRTRVRLGAAMAAR